MKNFWQSNRNLLINLGHAVSMQINVSLIDRIKQKADVLAIWHLDKNGKSVKPEKL